MQPPEPVVAAIPLAKGERLLAAARAGTGTWLVATTFALTEVAPEGQLLGRRLWHEVEAAAWNRDRGVLTVASVDRSDPARWSLDGEATFLAVLRERVQASVVLTDDVVLRGRRRLRVALRQDLSSGRVVEQVLGADVPLDEAAHRAVDEALARLREQTGLPPPDTT